MSAAFDLILGDLHDRVVVVGQQQLLVGMGCNQLQGFLLARPLPEADLVRQLTLDAQGQLRIGTGKSV